MEVVEDILAHHGVKGMRWGIRRKATVGPQEIVVRDRRRRLTAKGGKGFPAHADAVRARTIEQKARKSGFKSLSDEELRTLQNRLSLERNVTQGHAQRSAAGKQFVDNLLKTIGDSKVGN